MLKILVDLLEIEIEFRVDTLVGFHLVLQNSDYKNIQGFVNPTSGTRIEMVIDMRKCKSDVSLEHLSKEAQDDRLNTRKSGLSHTTTYNNYRHITVSTDYCEKRTGKETLMGSFFDFD